MVPTSLVLVDELPLLPNGKLDLAALPALEHRRDATGPTFIAPRSPSEIQLAAIWAELLGLEQIGIHDNFFDLGGHSLLSTQAITRMRRAFSVELQLRAFFEQPTIAELAALIDRQQQTQSASQTARPQAIPRINRTVRRAVTQLEQLSEHEVQMLLQANQSATKGTEE
jgi:acyl carrier protein